MYMAIQESTSNPEADKHLNNVPDGDSVLVEQASKLPPETFDLTFSDDLWDHEPKPGDPSDLVQKQMRGHVWRTLCNICHEPIPAPFEPTSDEDFADTDRPVCYQVVPYHVEVQYGCFPWDAVGY